MSGMIQSQEALTKVVGDAAQNTSCPLCGKSDKVIPIAYGLPSLEMFEEAELGKIFLGGCLITEDMPLYHCKRDGFSF